MSGIGTRLSNAGPHPGRSCTAWRITARRPSGAFAPPGLRSYSREHSNSSRKDNVLVTCRTEFLRSDECHPSDCYNERSYTADLFYRFCAVPVLALPPAPARSRTTVRQLAGLTPQSRLALCIHTVCGFLDGRRKEWGFARQDEESAEGGSPQR